MLDLREVTQPLMEVTLLDGTVRSFDPLEILKRLEPQVREIETSDTLAVETFQRIRMALELSAEQATDYHLLQILKAMITTVQKEIAGNAEQPT